MIYRLDDEADAKRLQELAGTPNPTDLESDLHLARLLCEKAVNANNVGAAVALQNVIAKLSMASEQAKYRKGELLAKAAVLQLAEKMVGILAANISGKFIGWEEAIDHVRDDILTITCEARNPEIEEKMKN